MTHFANRKSTKRLVTGLIVLSAGFTIARADVVQPTATLPPPGGVYTLPFVCLSAVCLANARVSNFVTTLDLLSGGNELVTATAIFSADIFQNNGGSAGAALGPLSVGGTMNFTYFGRSLSIPLGTFNAQITDFDFAGTFNGRPFEVRQNPLQASTGQTTILAVPNTLTYQVSSFFDVFAELSLDGGPFVPGPERHAPLTEVPEPGSAGLLLLGLAGIAGIAFRHLPRRMISKSLTSRT